MVFFSDARVHRKISASIEEEQTGEKKKAKGFFDFSPKTMAYS